MDKATLEAALATLDTWIQIFAVLVAVGIVGEAGFGVRHWILNRRLQVIQHYDDQQQRAAVASLNKEAGDARRDAALAIEHASKAEDHLAGANERAAKAQQAAAEATLALERLRTPRTLNARQQERISAKLKSFAGTTFDVALNIEPEPQGLLPQIEDALKAAGWIEIDWKGGASFAEITFTRKDRPQAGIVAVSGVIIQMHPEQISELGQTAEAVASALNAEGITSQAQPGVGVPNINTKSIHILIGRKPQ